ncbi:MAG: DEAD/DEAH box helicase family protein [Leptolinea sp.]|jgi:DNA polymerase-3 subunit epsilon/ATP-dependent DNA helicase DinG|nr:DEAD/DEAH box helicase family protein [Leptolinea sp.]
MTSIVSLDIETTGLDPQNDAIIEIGAVKFNGSRIEAEYSQLINPGRPIPPMITQLTGITNEMVHREPPIKAVIQDFENFVGNCPVLGHNVRFDLSFLRRQRILEFNDMIDTYELAAVLLPTASRYNLGALGQLLSIPFPATHRALDDARATRGVYDRLIHKAAELPIELLAELVRQSDKTDWIGSFAFQQILRARSREPIQARKTLHVASGPLFEKPAGKLVINAEPDAGTARLDEEEIASMLEHGGPFAKFFSSYEFRPQQIEMLKAVTRAFSDGQHMLVEAGTGTGKSFAYLVPAAMWALRTNTRVVISTNTINLQDQLINKDIPDLREALGVDLRAVVLKGRSNYLCPRRLEMLRQRGPETAEEMRVLGKVLIWLYEGGTGDRNEINLNQSPEWDVWMRISAEDEGCKSETCQNRMGGECPFYRSRQAAAISHLIVVNHALLLSDVAAGSRILPEYNYLIIDEGHHMEDATTNALAFKVTQFDIDRLIHELGGLNSGLLGRFLVQFQGVLQPSDLAALQSTVRDIADLAFKVTSLNNQFFTAIDDFLTDQRDGRPMGTYPQQERIQNATRTLNGWNEVEGIWYDEGELIRELLSLISGLIRSAGNDDENNNEELEDVIGSLSTLSSRFTDIFTNLTGLVSKPNNLQIYWIEKQPTSNRITLQMAPLHIGPLMEEHIWHQKTSVVLTSATLTAHGEFDYLRSRLNADEAGELALGSPFDYENSALVYLINDIPEITDAHGYQRAMETGLVRLARATNGRMLVLFTSYAQLKKTSQDIAAGMADAGIQIYEQGVGASANSLLENFRGAEKAVLLGTRSFWEGVDIPGEALSVLAITKLPFDVPSDPIIAARSETFEDPFNEYSLPEAILRFRQGFGRLIRTQSDRGVVAVFDKRLLTKKYGKLFLESIPDCHFVNGTLAELPHTAARWLNL